MDNMSDYIKSLAEICVDDLPYVGGKNSNLGEMINHLSQIGIQVPGGFAVTTAAYQAFMEEASLSGFVLERLSNLDVSNLRQLAAVGEEIREKILETNLPEKVSAAIARAVGVLDAETKGQTSVAVRSSATAEDMPEASFAGQQETYLNVHGIDNVVEAVRKVYASLFNDRAIAYRTHQGVDHSRVAISVGVQRMVRSDLASSGVVFTLDTESGFEDVVLVTASYGLGEALVQGIVNPDEYYLYKPNVRASRSSVLWRKLGSKESKMIYGDVAKRGESVRTVAVENTERSQFVLLDEELEELARQAVLIENHYGRPMDIEWAKDGERGDIWIVQARPETVKSRKSQTMERYRLRDKGDVLVEGRAVGQKISSGIVRVISRPEEMDHLGEGEVLVTDMTDPDWEPVMKRAAAVVTNRGGRTCHAAIIARELGVPAVVGSRDATRVLSDGIMVTVSCAEGDTGVVYRDALSYDIDHYDLQEMPKLPLKMMLNVANPERAFHFANLPHNGIGLARVEFIINNSIGVHPKALLEFESLPVVLQNQIREYTIGYKDPVEFFVSKLAEGISMLGAAFAPEPVIVRLSDFKSNEYAHLLAGDRYEPTEANPMIGFRGASRYLADSFKDCFALECRAIRRVRDDMGLTNVQVMIPFVRTVQEAALVCEALAENGLERGRNGLQLIMMCEIPSNVILAKDFLEFFDGFSIGSNDLTQLTLALDRDSALVAPAFDERNPAVKILLRQVIKACKAKGKYVGICGQGPSDYPDFAEWLRDEGIDSISINPDSVVETWLLLAGETVGKSNNT